MASNSDILTSPDKENESHEGITVAIRMRPLNKAEGDKQRIWKVLPKYNSVTQTTNTGKPLSERITGRTFFTFDKVFGEDDNTVQIYDNVAKGIVSSVVNGLNGTIFAYGQTSSGKTYTMQGSGSIQEGASSHGGGIVHMAAKDIFSQIQSQPNRMFLVRASFLEIYNEDVRDLLSNSSQTLQVREDPRRGVFVQSQEEMVTDYESLLRLLFQGEKSRTVASTQMNERSSRSHTIFRITIESREKDNVDANEDYSESGGDGAVRVSTLNLVDLAGSESVRHTGATGDRQKEGGMINQSLLTLSRVIVALGQPNQMHINFRDSKLTRILQPSLSGNARMAVICCATPSELYLEETRSTLQFASRAKLVKTNAQVNEVLDDRSIIRKLQRELAEARGQKTGPGTEHLRALENKAATAGTAAMEANEKLNRLKASILNTSHLLGNAAVGGETQQPYHNLRSRKRRQSDGGVPPSAHSSTGTPLKGGGSVASSPRTAPRKKKEKKYHPALSPRSELTILRQALSTRSELSRSLKETLEKNSQILDEKEDEVKNLVSENDGLAEEKEHAYTELSNLQEALASVQANLDNTISEYDTLLEEKENVILETFQKVEAENTKVAGLEDSNTKLLEQFEELQQRFDSLQEERVRSAFELALSTEEKEKLLSEKEQDKLLLQEMNQKIGVLTTAANDAEAERDASEETIRDLQERLEATSEENSAAQERAAALETDVASLREETAEERRVSQAFKEEIESRLESVVQEKDDALTTITELEETVQKTKEEVAAAQEESSQVISNLEREYDNSQTKITDLEGSLENTMVEKTDVLERASSLEQELRHSEELLENASNKISEMETTASEERQDTEKLVGELQGQLEVITTEKADALARLGELQQVQNDLTGELARAEEELECMHDSKEQALAQIAALQDDLTRNGQDLEAAQLSACDLCASISDLEEKLRQVETELAMSRNTETSLTAQCDALQLEHSNLQHEVEQLVHQNAEMEAFLSQSQVATNRQAAELMATNEALVTQNARLEASLSGKDGELQWLREEESSIKIENTKLQDELSSVQSAFVGLRTQATAKEIEKSDLVGQIGAMGSELEELRAECIELESTADTVRQTETALKAELVSSQEQLLLRTEEKDDILNAKEKMMAEKMLENADLREENASLNAGLRESRDSHAALECRYKALEKANASLATESDDLQERFSVLREEKSELERFLSAAEEEINTVQEQKAALEIELAELQNSLDTTHEEFEKSTAKLSNIQERHAEIENELERSQQVVEALELEKQQLQESLNRFDVERIEMESRHMSLETEKMAALAQHDSWQVDHKDNLGELEDHLAERDEQIEMLSAEKKEVFDQSEIYRNELEEIQAENRSLAALKKEHATKDNELRNELDATVEELKICEAKVAFMEDEKNGSLELIGKLQSQSSEKSALESELGELQALHDNADRMLTKYKTDLEQATSARDNALETLQDREKERDEAVSALEDLYRKNHELSQSLANSLPFEKEAGFQKELTELKQSNLELTQLLASSTGSEGRLRGKVATFESDLLGKSRELEDSQYRLSQLEEELRQSELAFEEKLLLNPAESSSNSDEALLQEIESLQKAIEHEQSERRSVEVSLKRQMGEEQRVLIHEGEKMMEALRSKATGLEERLSESEQEAYTCRQQLEEVQDQKEAAERNYMKLESVLDDLKTTVTREENQVSSLRAELNKAREETYALKENAVEMKAKIRKAEAHFEKVNREEDAASSEIAMLKRQVSSIEKRKTELQAECDRMKIKLRTNIERNQLRELSEQINHLQRSLEAKDETIQAQETTVAAIRQENKKLLETTGGSDALVSEVTHLKAKIKEKDQRIKKLQTFKLTKEFAEEHKQLKKDNKSLREELSRLQNEVSNLQSQLQSTDSDSGLRTEISELRFDKEALEKKLRKFATHCQRLEDDKAGMASALRSCNFDPSDYQGDINEAVVSVCDKLTSLEESESVRSRRSSSSTDRLESDNEALQTKLERLSATEERLNEQISHYQSEIEALRKKLKGASGSSSDSAGESGETSRKLRYLEQENLQLMFDVKTTKKQLQAAREENEVLRMNAMDNSTLDFGTVDLGSDSSQLSKVAKPSNTFSQPQQSRETSTKAPLVDKTNGSLKENVPNRIDQKRPVGRLPRLEKAALRNGAPGLGDAAVQGDETGECNQS